MKNKLQVGKRTDSHINRNKRRKKHTIEDVFEVIITYEYKNIKKTEKHTIDDYDN